LCGGACSGVFVAYNERSDLFLINYGITSLVVFVFPTLNVLREAEVCDELRIPSIDEFGQKAGFSDETTDSVVLDHKVHSAEEVVKLQLGVESEGFVSIVHVRSGRVADILDGVVVIGHFSIVGVVQAKVRVLSGSQVANFEGGKGGRTLGTTNLGRELLIVPVFRSCNAILDSGSGWFVCCCFSFNDGTLSDARNIPLGNGKASHFSSGV